MVRTDFRYSPFWQGNLKPTETKLEEDFKCREKEKHARLLLYKFNRLRLSGETITGDCWFNFFSDMLGSIDFGSGNNSWRVDWSVLLFVWACWDLGHCKKQVLICTILLVYLILTYNFVVDVAHFVLVRKTKRLWLVCLCPYKLTAASTPIISSVCLCVCCVESSFAQQSSFFPPFLYFQADRPGRPGSLPQGYLREMLLCCGREEIWKSP